MILSKKWRLVKAAFIGLFALFGLSLLHVNMSLASSGMDDMAGHGSNGVQCLISCSTMLPGDKQDGILPIQRDDERPDPQLVTLATVCLSLLAVAFVVKFLLLLSSWRPPDRVLLYGLYGNSL